MSTPDPVPTPASAPNPFEQAAIPSAIAILQALQTFDANMGPDPQDWPANYPGAKLTLLGSIALQYPALLNGEGAALMTAASTELGSWISTLKAAQTASEK